MRIRLRPTTTTTETPPPPAVFDRDRCAQRNRVAARRDGVNAVRLRFVQAHDLFTAADSDARRPITARGRLPKDMAGCLERINALLPETASPLTESDVYVHFLEAANSNFISDRYMFMDPSTLRNIAADASAGFAFMNSHRTGGLSHPAQLPMGKTFAGRYEMFRDPGDDPEPDQDGPTPPPPHEDHVTHLGIYMLRGVRPNGQDGPSTDDLHRMIDGGTVADVSVGLYGGSAICDVCGEDLDAWDRDRREYLCPHVPGTDRKMTADEKRAQKARGVPDGAASYSLVGAHCGEVSAVYDGAVPGAGFRKALGLAHQLSRDEVSQVTRTYNRLISRGGKEFGMEFDLEDIVSAVATRLGLRRPRVEAALAQDPAPALAPASAQYEHDGAQPAAVVELQAQLAEERKAREEQESRFRQELEARFTREAEAFASRVLEANKALPYESGDVSALHRQLATDDYERPLPETPDGTAAAGRLARFEALLLARSPHRLTESLLPSGLPAGAVVLGSGSEEQDAWIERITDTAAEQLNRRNNNKARNGTKA